MTYDKKNIKLGPILRKAREEAGLQMDGVAQKLDITTATLSRIETGKISVTADRIAELAGLYGLSVAELLRGRIRSTPSSVDLDRLHAIVMLVQDVILDLGVSPSPQKVADVVKHTYLDEVDDIIARNNPSNHDIKHRHHQKITMMLRE